MITIYSTTNLADVNSKASLNFESEDYTDHFNTLTIHPLDLVKKNYVTYPDEEFIEKYSDYKEDLKFIATQTQGTLLGRDWILHNLEILEKALSTYEKTHCGIFVKIFYPETFLDSEWLKFLWNVYGNIAKKTPMKLLVYTHTEMWHVYYLCNSWDLGSDVVQYRVYTGRENDETIVDKIYNKIKNLWNRIFHKNENKD